MSERGLDLLAQVESTQGPAVTLWWLGHCGFIVKSHGIVFYIDPFLAAPETPLEPELATNADMILCTHSGPTHMHPPTLRAMLAASPRAKIVMPKSAAEHAHRIGIPYPRMTTTDSDLRVEYFKSGQYGRVYSVPSAHPDLGYTPSGGYPRLGYLIRFGGITIYHAGDCRPYDGLVDRLRPYNVTAALLPTNGNGNFEAAEAAQLAEDIGARWLIPMHTTDSVRLVDHMLGFRPGTGFKVFQPGECWTIPE